MVLCVGSNTLLRILVHQTIEFVRLLDTHRSRIDTLELVLPQSAIPPEELGELGAVGVVANLLGDDNARLIEADNASALSEEQQHVVEGALLVLRDELGVRQDLAEDLSAFFGLGFVLFIPFVERVLPSRVQFALDAEVDPRPVRAP